MSPTHPAILLLVLALLVAACGNTAADTDAPAPPEAPATSSPPPSPAPGSPNATVPFTNGEEVKLEVPRATTGVAESDLTAVVTGDRQFGLDLLQAVADDENVLLSPYSIATALSMLFAGARGTTATEIADVLHVTVDSDVLHAARNEIDQLLVAAPPPPGVDDTREPFTIRPANAAWGQGGYPFSPDYLEVLATYYGAGLRLTDFAADPAGATDTINQWVEDATENRIQDLIPPGTIDAASRLVLVNAIWFYANWADPFEPDLTEPGQFTLVDGSELTVPMMHGSPQAGYAATDLYEAVRLPYAGDAAMVVMLPNQGTPADLIGELSPDAMAPRWTNASLDVTMPSFEFESEIPLKQVLMDLGIRTAFEAPSPTAGADLTGITPARELFVTDALHKAFIALDEHGTEAAAATALVVGLTAAGPPPQNFVADRPFLFWIEHVPTGEVLFLGQVTNPAG